MHPSYDDDPEYGYVVDDLSAVYERLVWLDSNSHQIKPSDSQIAQLRRLNDHIKWRLVKIKEKTWDQRLLFLQN